MASSSIRPARAADIADAIADALRAGERLAITGGGSKADIGFPVDDVRPLELGDLSGVVDYDPRELVLTVRAGTPLAEVQALLAGERQMLAFDPFDHGPIFGRPVGRATIGGIVAAGVAGSRRLSQGGARDHLLGFQAVSGRGEIFVAGGKVVKNVTGYDLPKLAAGSWGRLFALAELTLKVLPAPRMSATRFVFGLDPGEACRLMARAAGSRAEIVAAAHMPAGIAGGRSITALRVQGFGPAVGARCAVIEALASDSAPAETPSQEEANAFWRRMRDISPLAGDRLWRVNLPPSAAPAFIAALGVPGAHWIADWAGGLLWIEGDQDPERLRQEAARAGGHAMLVRAPTEMRAIVPALHPPPGALAALEARVRRAFDPAGLFETGRFAQIATEHRRAD